MFFSFLFTFLLYRVMNRESYKVDAYIVSPTSLNFGEYFSLQSLF